MHTTKVLSIVGLSLALAACDDGPTQPLETGYDITVTGDFAARVRGEAFFGSDTDESGAPIFAILLGQDTSSHTILMGRSGTQAPVRGEYPVGEESGWTAIYILSAGDELAGVLVADSGRITIAESAATRMRGTVDLYASGLIDDDDGLASVRVTGTFSARPAPDAASRVRLPF
jgi:hypothetical protein